MSARRRRSSRHGAARRQRRRRRSVLGAILGAIVVLGLIAGTVGSRFVGGVSSDRPTVTVITTGGTVDETDVSIDGKAALVIKSAAEANGQLNLVKVNGDGATSVEPYDLTPRDGNGAELVPPTRREQAIEARVAELAATMNSFDTSVGGRSVLSGLQNVPAGDGPILVYSTALDLNDPVSYVSLGFDVDPRSVVKQLTAAKELPVNLKGRHIIFIFTPTAGEQRALRQPQVIYRERLLRAIAQAGGARTVEFIAGRGGLPTGAGGDAPEVPIPPSETTIKGKKTVVVDEDGTKTVTTKCVIPSPLLFQPDSSKLLDVKAAEAALTNCIGHAKEASAIRVDGHTACRNAPDSDAEFARKLSENRARRIVDIAVKLGINRKNSTVHGWGSTKPIKKPCSDPANRASVVTITTDEGRAQR